ncbi:Zn-ribbon domain-containing OB-fold protein [Novosphingobium malaysiense]|uniref:ChsH2 C-terminal OB-fold domain-containing protein n=1 Tax=Novosphingobium malaysiense TaxID=1348853 RepID=A0A0B1ZM24_9SPHN|nr:OB-fold domain-containing protein [Novosphingobium malaysiense]KHK90243.1 hypothetical protein LK12_16465 [Novosphingobium malaysiense]
MAHRRPDRTLGPGHDEFWAWCDKQELRLPKCQACGKLAWPVTPRCQQCDASKFVWVQLSGRGSIVSWGTFVQDYYRGQMATPYDTILVELEEGVLFISNPDGFGEQDISPGMEVSVRFIDCEDSAGPFRLPVFCRSS